MKRIILSLSAMFLIAGNMAFAQPTYPTDWTLIFNDDFNDAVAEGSFLSVYGVTGRPNVWWAYPDNWLTTHGNNGGTGDHYDTKTISVINGVSGASAGTMRMRLYRGSDGKAHGCAPVPILDGKSNGNSDQLYGRYEVRFWTDVNVAGWKTAWLLWPQSGKWPEDGEIDFPEGELNGTIGAFMHRQNGTSGGDQDGYGSNVPYGPGWHVAILEWAPNWCRFIIDGNVIGTSTNRVPNTPMHYVMQTENNIGGTQPGNPGTCMVYVDYMKIWKYTPGQGCVAPTVNVSAVNANCFGNGNDGSISLSVTGGTPPYTYSWSNGATTKDITGIGPGTYSVTISDSKSCDQVKQAVISKGDPLAKGVWSVKYVDSEELAQENGSASNAFDGDPATIWHTEWSASSPAHPHRLEIDLGANYFVSGFRYLPRQSGGLNGTIAGYELHASMNGNNWKLLNAGTFPSNNSEKTVSFAADSARYFALVALSEINGNNWTSAAELEITGCGLTTGIIQNNPVDAVAVYPNPASDVLTIYSEKAIEEVQIINMLGEKIYTEKNILTDKIILSANNFPPGLYSISVTTKAGIFIRKINIIK
jgi:hypothetical protein